ncbi:MAG: hypothetical protein WAL80_25930 [Xanthobacteraceae bacterium]
MVDQNPDRKVRTISEKWENWKQAAPYIFAFYNFFSETLTTAKTVDDLVDLLEAFTSDQALLDQHLGNAAYIADVLAERKVRDVRKKDFDAVKRTRPKTASFDLNEMKIITAIDPNRLSAEDIRDYRPKSSPSPI